jgi:iron transport multicopper oxidase
MQFGFISVVFILLSALDLLDARVQKFTLILERKKLPGHSITQFTINGTVPGPAIHVVYGNSVEVTVINNIKGRNEIATVHWHGMTQRNTPSSDGPIGIAQCPIYQTSGQNTMVYEFTPQTNGTFWYHGHFGNQITDGLFGPLIVHPTYQDAAFFAKPDQEKWVWTLADWYGAEAASLVPAYLSPASGGDEPLPDAYVVNNNFDNTMRITTSIHSPPVTVRVINAAAFSMFKVSVDGLPLSVFEIDAGLVQPLDLPYFVVNAAQRVVFKLDFSKLDQSLLLNSDSIYFRVEGIPQMYPTYDPLAPDHKDSSESLPINLFNYYGEE